jgi:hypothetical protein
VLARYGGALGTVSDGHEEKTRFQSDGAGDCRRLTPAPAIDLAALVRITRHPYPSESNQTAMMWLCQVGLSAIPIMIATAPSVPTP